MNTTNDAPTDEMSSASSHRHILPVMVLAVDLGFFLDYERKSKPKVPSRTDERWG